MTNQPISSNSHNKSLLHAATEYHEAVLQSERLFYQHIIKKLKSQMNQGEAKKIAKLVEGVNYDKKVDDLYNQVLALKRKNDQLENTNELQKENFDNKIQRCQKEIKQYEYRIKELTGNPTTPRATSPLRKTIHLLTPRQPFQHSEKRATITSTDDIYSGSDQSPNLGIFKGVTINDDDSHKNKFREVLSKNTIFDRSVDDIFVINNNETNKQVLKKVENQKDTIESENGDKLQQIEKRTFSEDETDEEVDSGSESLSQLAQLEIPKSASSSISTDYSTDVSSTIPITKKRKLSKNKVINL